MNFVPKGIIPALVTPLKGDEIFNEDGMRQLVNYVIEGGVHGLFVTGTSGEFYGITPEEKKVIIEVVIDENRGRVPVYVGTAAVTTKECIMLTNIAEECGADAVSILTPTLINLNQDELIEHYTSIAINTSLPVFMYNNLPRTGINIEPETVERLANIGNIMGIKDSSGDFTLMSEYIRRTRDKKFYVLSGRDTLIHACLCHGGSGSIASCANIAPRLCADIYDLYMEGDIEGSLEAQFALAPLRLAFGLGTFPTIIKEALNLMGINVGGCIGPVGPIGQDERQKLMEILDNLGLV